MREMIRDGSLEPGMVDPALNALVTTKLGRGSDQLGGSLARVFTFTHRRIQEYFATCVVLRNPAMVPQRQLLTDGRWRETAVTILQTQTASTAQPLLAAAEALLRDAISQIEASKDEGRFTWPAGSEHLLGILTQGLGRNPEEIGSLLRDLAGTLVSQAWKTGRPESRAAALRVVLCSSDATAEEILQQALASDSALLRERAFQQIAWMRQPPPSVDFGIRRFLVGMWASSQLWQKRATVRVQFQRISQGRTLLKAHMLLLTILAADFILLISAAALTDLAARPSWAPWYVAFLALTLAHLGFRIQRDGMADSSLAQSRRTLFMRSLRTIAPRGRSRQRVGGLIRWVSAIAVLVPLLSTRSCTSLINIIAIAAVIIATAWPNLFIDHYILRRPIWPNGDHWSGHTISMASLVSIIAALTISLRAAHIQLPTSPPDTQPEKPFTVSPMWAIIGITIGSIVALAVIVSMMIYLILWYRANRASAHAIASIYDRDAAFSADEITTLCKVLNSQSAFKALVLTFRSKPLICSSDALDILSDLAAAADGKGNHHVGRAPIPPGSSVSYRNWAESDPKCISKIIRCIDSDTIDNITLLTEEVRGIVSR